MDKIENGDRFPTVEADALDQDDPIRLPDAVRGGPSVLVFYRGHW